MAENDNDALPAESLDRTARRSFGMTDADVAAAQDPSTPLGAREARYKEAREAAAKQKEEQNGTT